jgi:HK97 family phage prohead protease
MSTTATELLHVRPAWGSDAPPITRRAAALLVSEWRRLGVLDDDGLDDDPDDALAVVQLRAAVLAARSGRRRVQTRAAPATVATLADSRPSGTCDAEWPILEGVLVPLRTRALIGIDGAGRPVYERFLPGSVTMPGHGSVLLNREHNRTQVLGHVTSLGERDGAVRIRARFVDTTTVGADTAELVKAGSLTGLSIEFHELPGAMTLTELPNGRLVTHSKVNLHGVGVVPVPAYAGARVTRYLDRAEAGRQAETDRRKTVRHLAALAS